jgi:hypothetical protein
LSVFILVEQTTRTPRLGYGVVDAMHDVTNEALLRLDKFI